MSLHFIFGRAGTGKTTRCCREIVDFLSHDPDAHAILLVPDQATYRAETALAESCPSGGFVGADVYGFSRLSYRVFQELHTDTHEAISPLVQQLIWRRILNARKKDMRMLGKAAGQPHFASTLTTFFHQLDSFGITEETLQDAAAAAGDTPLGRKLSDLSLLRHDYLSYLTAHFSYRGNRYERLAEDIPQSDAIRASKIWIDGFNGMTPQEIAVVSALIRTAKDVTVTLPMDAPETAALYPLFDRPYRLWKALTENTGSYTSETLTAPHRFECPRVRELAERFFRPLPEKCIYGPATRTLPEQGVFITECPSREAEVEDVVCRIAELTRDKNFRYRDILVLTRNPDTYGETLRRKLSEADIPAFLDMRRLMTTHPLVQLVSSLLHLLTETKKSGGFKNATLFAFLKNPLYRMFAEDDTDRLENYVHRVGVRPYQWKKEWTFRSYFHLEADSPMSAKEAEELRYMNTLRAAVVNRLLPLETAWNEAETVRDKTEILYRWLVSAGIPSRLSAADEQSYAETKTRPHREVWKNLLALFDDLVCAAGDDRMPDADYLSMTEDALRTLTYALIPPTLDHVTVTSIDRGYAIEARAVFILGANEGEFPARITEEGILSEADKKTLSEKEKLILAPDLTSLIYQEEFYTYLALTRARHALYLSYATTETDGSELSPSSLLSRLERLGYTTARRTPASLSPDMTDDTRFIRPAQSLALLPGVLRNGIPPENGLWAALRDYAHAENEAALVQAAGGLRYTNGARPLSRALARRLFIGKYAFKTSVSRLEKYRKCPYEYFLEYGLRLTEEKEATVDNLDVGNYLHAGLHKFGEHLKQSRKAWRDATDEDIEKTSKEIADAIAPRIKDGALSGDAAAKYTKNALDRTLRKTLATLRAQSKSSMAETVAMEHNFQCPVRAGSDTVTLTGSIDRLDVAGGAAVICDYKTGTPTLSLSEIVSGLKLQLITYLMAALETSENPLLPGAILYLYVQGNTRTVPVSQSGTDTKPAKELAGYFLGDRRFLESLDINLGKDGGFLPIRVNKDGGFSKNSPVLTEAELRALFEKTKENIAALYENMKGGNIAIRPTRLKKCAAPCTFCPYKSICRFDPTMPGNRYEEIPAKSDSDIKKEFIANT